MSDYISREAVLLHLNDIWLSASPTDTMYDDDRQLAMVRCMGLNDAMDVVKDAPAADVRPVVRGKWIKYAPHNSDMMTCSECEKYWILDGEQYDYHYCPNCGAMMEES